MTDARPQTETDPPVRTPARPASPRSRLILRVIVFGALLVMIPGAFLLRTIGLSWERIGVIGFLALAAGAIALIMSRLAPPDAGDRDRLKAGYTRGRGMLAKSLVHGQCPTCGYSLLGLPDLVCPECGIDASISLLALGLSEREVAAFRADVSRAGFGGDRDAGNAEEIGNQPSPRPPP